MRIYALQYSGLQYPGLQYPGKFADSAAMRMFSACIVVTARGPPARHG
jgi:hypothetical protein